MSFQSLVKSPMHLVTALAQVLVLLGSLILLGIGFGQNPLSFMWERATVVYVLVGLAGVFLIAKKIMHLVKPKTHAMPVVAKK